MENAIYASLNRQAGLMSEMRAIANNIANASTTGFRKEGVVFAEHVKALGGGEPSLSMAMASGRLVNLEQGGLKRTGGTFDLAIEGDGFFMVQTPSGQQLTRAGNFTPSPEGELVTADGYPVLDTGGSPIPVPPGTRSFAVAQDGTLSADGTPAAQIGLFAASDPSRLIHAGDNRFSTTTPPQPLEGGRIFQGFLEDSNVAPVTEIARMIEVQRAYEMGQSFLDKEDARIRAVIQSMTR